MRRPAIPVTGLVLVIVGVLIAVEAQSHGERAGELASASTYQDPRRGYTVTVPGGWHRAEASLAPTLVDPREILAVATFPLQNGDLCDALQRVPPGEAFVTVQERGRGAYGSGGFPARPARFEPDPALPGSSAWPYCVGGDDKPPIPILDYWFEFSDAGRAFHVFVGIGTGASTHVRREAFDILNSLRFDAAVKPDWNTVGYQGLSSG
jgi:hypothetical protein